MTELVVLRVIRPYATESEFLQSEDWTIKKNSVFLVSAPAHVEGTVVRCELVLSSGVQLIVAEGVVAKYVTQTTDRPAGLVVRFRRMTPSSTQFINRTLSIRDGEGSSPSAATHPVPLPPLKQAPSIPRQDFPRVGAKLPSTVGSAQACTPEALRRLSSRRQGPLSVPTDRASALQRLRQRTSETSRH